MVEQELRVGIVGAGISGLRCAHVLLERGVQVTILEARDRIGGRICQNDSLGYSVDLGPQWIHTSGENPLLRLAEDTRTPLHTWNGKTMIYDEQGQPVERTRADRLSSVVWDIFEHALRYSEESGHDIPETLSLHDQVAKRAAEVFPDSRHDQKLLVQMAQMWGAYIGDPPSKQSLRFAWLEKCCVGEEVILAGTFEAILEQVAKVPLASADIHFNTRVVAVEAAEDARERGSAIALRTEDGQTHVFDEVVLTTPLGWLKKNKLAFAPPIPPRLSQAIDSISVGHLEKVFITFPDSFWLDPAVDAKDDVYPGYTNFLSPRYAPGTNPEHWPQEAYNLAAFAAPNKHATLLFYLYGDCSRALISLSTSTSTSTATSPSNSPSDRPILHPCAPASSHPLYDFFLPYISLLPNYSPRSPSCTPTRILNTTWQLDDLAGNGSYVNFQVPVADAADDMRCLRQAMGDDRKVWFAGEHTSPPEESGTATGAYLSGEAVARTILDVAHVSVSSSSSR